MRRCWLAAWTALGMLCSFSKSAFGTTTAEVTVMTSAVVAEQLIPLPGSLTVLLVPLQSAGLDTPRTTFRAAPAMAVVNPAQGTAPRLTTNLANALQQALTLDTGSVQLLSAGSATVVQILSEGNNAVQGKILVITLNFN